MEVEIRVDIEIEIIMRIKKSLNTYLSLLCFWSQAIIVIGWVCSQHATKMASVEPRIVPTALLGNLLVYT